MSSSCFISLSELIVPPVTGHLKVIINVSCRLLGFSKFSRNHILILKLCLDLMDVVRWSTVGRSLMSHMTGSLQPGHKQFVSHDPRKASEAGGGRSVGQQFYKQMISVVAILLSTTHLFSIFFSDCISCFLLGGCDAVLCVLVFIVVQLVWYLCDHTLLFQCANVSDEKTKK